MKKLLGQQVESVYPLCLSIMVSVWSCPFIHTFPSTWLFQVGHRDLEDILRDIDLNGDGHVDFEGKESYAVHHTMPCYLYTVYEFHSVQSLEIKHAYIITLSLALNHTQRHFKVKS